MDEQLVIIDPKTGKEVTNLTARDIDKEFLISFSLPD